MCFSARWEGRKEGEGICKTEYNKLDTWHVKVIESGGVNGLGS